MRTIGLILAGCLISTACGKTIVRSHGGKTVDKSQTAMLENHAPTTLVAVDGVPLPQIVPRSDDIEVEFLPGKHSISLTTECNLGLGGDGSVQNIWFSAKAGARYELVGGVAVSKIHSELTISLSEKGGGPGGIASVSCSGNSVGSTTSSGTNFYCCGVPCAARRPHSREIGASPDP